MKAGICDLYFKVRYCLNVVARCDPRKSLFRLLPTYSSLMQPKQQPVRIIHGSIPVRQRHPWYDIHIVIRRSANDFRYEHVDQAFC